MSEYLLLFSSSLAFVGLKSWQQLNVVHRKYWWILPTSMLMAVCEVFVISKISSNGFGLIVLFVGFGAGLGSMAATWLHDYLMKGGK